MHESDDEQSEDCFDDCFDYIMKEISTRTTIVENNDSVTLYRKVCCLKKLYNELLINLDCFVITEKYQTSVFHVRNKPYRLDTYYWDLEFDIFP